VAAALGVKRHQALIVTGSAGLVVPVVWVVVCAVVVAFVVPVVPVVVTPVVHPDMANNRIARHSTMENERNEVFFMCFPPFHYSLILQEM
jgi:Flp pilus assembly protein TadB